ncbi:MlaE family lipid ABC transporter permease subunit [Coralliovum pocilloporae]|uniref:MlaE family lipid ABC transporter permease subunit n=1 Tax=Coralliovum pocilloporae TaxID=3066369 RepID=UPI003306C5E7
MSSLDNTVPNDTAGTLSVLHDGDALVLRPAGDWTLEATTDLDPVVRDVRLAGEKAIVADLSELQELDTAGAWILCRVMRRARKEGVSSVSVRNASDQHQVLLTSIASIDRKEAPLKQLRNPVQDILERLGRVVMNVWLDILAISSLIGQVILGVLKGLVGRGRIRFISVINQVERTGLSAVPIIALMSFLIGGIVAQQGAFQLRTFGAELFVVDLVGILVLREVGVLLTAIMIAGRSGSAFTAEIGSMKMREEIDALRVIGVDPVEVLVAPRLIGLVIALPLLTIISNLSGLFGAGMMAWAYSGLPPQIFLDRLQDAVELNTLFVGLIKAPFMGLIIALIACSEGLRTKGSAESLGRQTTISVVKAIFMVIVVDGLFAIFFGFVGY